MRLVDMGTLPLTLFVSLLVAIVLLALRVGVMHRVQEKRQRENRQETERLKFLVAAYRSLAGSFTPAQPGDRRQLEEALADIILFGDLQLVTLAADAATRLVRDGNVDLQPLVAELRIHLRAELGLEPLPVPLVLPPSGPGRAGGRGGEGEGGGGGRGGGGAGGAGGGAGGGGGVGMAGAGGGALAGGLGGHAAAGEADHAS